MCAVVFSVLRPVVVFVAILWDCPGFWISATLCVFGAFCTGFDSSASNGREMFALH